MKKFLYTAKNLNGKKVKGTYIAENEEIVKQSLAVDNLFLIKCKQVSNKASSPFFSLTGKVSVTELSNFCKQFSIMISSGISIIDSINILKKQNYSTMLKTTLEKINDHLNAGDLLSDAMSKYPKVFPKFFTSMIYIGETSGRLDRVLIEMASYYSRSQLNQKKIKSALAYPITLVVLMVAVLVVIFNFVIPTFIESFTRMDIEMPAITIALFNFSVFFQSNWQYIALAFIIIVAIIYLVGKTKKGKYFFDMLKVKLPIFKTINIAVFTSKLTQSLALLLSSGMDIVSSLQSMNKIVDNTYLQKQFQNVIKDVVKGVNLSTALETEMKLSPILIQMVSVGEKTGKLDQILLSSYDYFDQQVANALNLISTIIQPVLLITLGSLIAVIFVAIYSPILSMVTTLK